MPDTLDQSLERGFQLLDDVDFGGVRAWKQQSGGKAIAYFPVYGPQEIIHAAGMLPVCVAGAGDRLDLQHADARFGSFICSIVKSTLELALTSRLDLFDGFLFSSICDSARNLCWVVKRNLPAEKYVDFLHLPHNPSSRSATEFLAAEYRRVAAELAKLSGTPVRDHAVADAIALYNQERALVRQLYQFRNENPHLLRAWESYLLVRMGHFMPVQEHTRILRAALDELPRRTLKKRDSLRVVIEGAFCEQPPLELIKLLENAGCYIVDDDFTLQQNWFTSDVPEHGDPYRNLASSYLDRSVYSSVRHDWRAPRSEGLAQKVKRAKADAVIFLTAKFCEPAYFDYVLFRKKLDETGVPHLLLEYEEKLFTFERLRTEVETFVESLVFD
jgi:benzoyl-CoA reductase subunit C